MIFTMSLSTYAESYYDLTCSAQAKHMKSIAKLRDKGYSKSEIIPILQSTYPKEYHKILISLLDTVFTLQNSNPDRIYTTTLNSCKNHAKKVPHQSLIDNTGLKSRGNLNKDGKRFCINLSQVLNKKRDELTAFEREIEVMSAILKDSMSELNSQGSQASNIRIKQHNKNAKRFSEINQSYRQVAKQYNIETQTYNSKCGGMSIN